jgi:hypothetical protein
MGPVRAVHKRPTDCPIRRADRTAPPPGPGPGVSPHHRVVVSCRCSQSPSIRHQTSHEQPEPARALLLALDAAAAPLASQTSAER